MRFLVVDDDVAIRDLLTRILNHLGHQDVTVAPSAQVALRYIEACQEPFDCILLDIQMPGMDGVELCHVLRRMEGYRDVPIVMLTAMSERDYLDRAFRNGATDYVQKPFEVAELGVRINIAVRLARSQARLRQVEAERGEPGQAGAEDRRAFEDVVPVEGIAKAVDYLTFENYVLAPPMKLLVSSSAVGIRVAGLEAVHGKVTDAEFRRLIYLVARCIQAAQGETGPLFTYAGAGVFLILRTRGSTFDEDALRRRFQETVRSKAATLAGPDLARKLRVHLGEPERLWSFKRGERARGLQRARAKAEETAQSAGGSHASSSDAGNGRLDYEAILREINRPPDDFFFRKRGPRGE